MEPIEKLQSKLHDQGISVEIVGSAIYRFSQFGCEWMIPQHIIDNMLDQDFNRTSQYVVCKLFYLVRRIDDLS